MEDKVVFILALYLVIVVVVRRPHKSIVAYFQKCELRGNFEEINYPTAIEFIVNRGVNAWTGDKPYIDGWQWGAFDSSLWKAPGLVSGRPNAYRCAYIVVVILRLRSLPISKRKGLPLPLTVLRGDFRLDSPAVAEDSWDCNRYCRLR